MLRGGNGPFTLSGFVSDTISKALADRLLSKTLKRLTGNITLYVSNNGIDESADGTENKPFKTLQACLNYIKDNYASFSNKNNITVKFLTDYEDNTPYYVFHFVLTGGNSAVNINGENHTVKIAPFTITGCTVNLYNVTIKYNQLNNSNRFVIDCVYNALVRIYNNCKIEIDVNDTTKGSFISLFMSRFGSLIAFYDNVQIEFKQDLSNISIFCPSLNSFIDFLGNVHVNSTSNLTNFIIIQSSWRGQTSLGNFTVDGNATIQGKKYDLTNGSCINFKGRGEDVIKIGSETGTKDENSFIR